jgi:hypothetical protein
MKFLLKLKHWQLFLLTWGSAISISVYTISDPALSERLYPLVMFFFALGTWGWMWAISVGLQKLIPVDVKLKFKKFKILFLIPVIYLIIILIGTTTSAFHRFDGEGSSFSAFEAILIIVHLISMFGVFYGLRFAAKTLKTVELGRLAKFSDYAGEFFLIWFSFIGYWILQPRINRLMMKHENNNDYATQ